MIKTFSDLLDVMQLKNMDQRPVETLRIYIYRYSKTHQAATGKDDSDKTNPSRLFRFLACISSTAIADKNS